MSAARGAGSSTGTPAGSPIARADALAEQRAAWSEVAPGWRRWWRVFEGAAQPLNERLVALARVFPGARVLDVATGLGEPALTAARAAGRAGRVLATDLAPGMVRLGLERAREQGLARVAFAEMDAGRLALRERSFDAATCRFGLMLFPDPGAGLGELARVLRPGAHCAAAVWGDPARVPFLRIGQDVAVRELGLEPPAPDAPGAFRLAAPGALAALFESAGFEVVEHELVSVRFAFESADEYARFMGDLSGSLRRALAGRTADERAHALGRVARAASDELGSARPFVLENEVVCVAGRSLG